MALRSPPRGRARVGVVFVAVLLVCVGAGCWPAEGFDASRWGFNPLERPLTTANVGGLTRAWGINTGATATTPIVVGNRVFVGAGDAVEAYDTANGAARWVTHNNDYASSGLTGSVGALTAVGGTVLGPVNWGLAGGLFTFDDATGARRGSPEFHAGFGPVAERGDVSAHVQTGFGSAGQPFFVYLHYGTHIALLASQPNLAITGPTIVGPHVLVGVANTVQSYSLDTCTPDPSPAEQFCAPEWSATMPAAPSDPVGVGSREAAIGLANGDVAMLDVATGALQWTAHTGATAATAPATANGQLYVGAADGRLYAFATAGCGHATCGPEWWGATATGAAVSHQPAAAADVVYVGITTGRVYAFRASGCGAASCPALWNGAVNPSGPAAPVVGPVVSDGSVYASAGAVVAAFRLAH